LTIVQVKSPTICGPLRIADRAIKTCVDAPRVAAVTVHDIKIGVMGGHAAVIVTDIGNKVSARGYNRVHIRTIALGKLRQFAISNVEAKNILVEPVLPGVFTAIGRKHQVLALFAPAQGASVLEIT